ncbi:MAG TPA: di-heme oxidoredictase family protein [Bacteroidia bacterium]|nr:di-heme oxidoredictase family protein [Bacteroidia bacterium]
MILKTIHAFIFLVVLTGFISCDMVMPPAPADDEILDGPVEGLSHEENLRFLRGDIAFNDEVFTSENGLGPVFVATSCGSCHAGDGKGHPFTTLVRYGQWDSTGNQYLNSGGPQLQHRALPGFNPEQMPAGMAHSKIVAPANTGLGFLEAIPDNALLAYADPFDGDGDGISGRPNWINIPAYTVPRPGAVTQNGMYIGRFGKKAGVYDLVQQTAGAYNQDIGITSVYEPRDVYTRLDIDPEISTQTLLDVVFYLQTLKAPIQRKQSDARVLEGKTLFTQAGCAKCHVPQYTTGPSPIAALSNKTVYPYTDLLLHDMGPALNDGYTEGSATTAEWRTPALWGLGLSANSQGGSVFLMHDGRAHSIEEAILLHGGEGQQSNNNYKALTEEQKKALVTFLESL